MFGLKQYYQYNNTAMDAPINDKGAPTESMDVMVLTAAMVFYQHIKAQNVCFTPIRFHSLYKWLGGRVVWSCEHTVGFGRS